MTDEAIIEVIAHRMEEECGWSQASVVFNHYAWVDVVTHLFCEKGLRERLLYTYADEILRQQSRNWQADRAARDGSDFEEGI